MVTKFDAYPMPRIEEVFESIGPAKIIPTLDLAKGYWQIPLTQESQEKTAFVLRVAQYDFFSRAPALRLGNSGGWWHVDSAW